MTAHSFYAALQDAQTQDEMAATIIQYLLGATEYRRFVDLLIDRKIFHFGPGSKYGLAAARNGGCIEEGMGAGSKESLDSDDDRCGISKSSDEGDRSALQYPRGHGNTNNRDGRGGNAGMPADFSCKVSESDNIDDQSVGRKEDGRGAVAVLLRK